MKFNKALGATNAVLKRAGRTSTGQSKEGMKWLNEQLRNLNLQSKRQYKFIATITKPAYQLTKNELARVKLRRKVYRLSADIKQQSRKISKALGELGGGTIRWAEENGDYAIEAIKERIKGIDEHYIINPRTGKKILGVQAYLGMEEQLKELPVWKFWKGNAQDRMLIAREMIEAKLEIIFAYDSEVRHELCTQYGWGWTNWSIKKLIQEIQANSRSDVTGAIQQIAKMARVKYDKLLNFYDRITPTQDEIETRKKWAT